MKTTHPSTNDVYTIVTNRIIELLEKGVVPWQQSWTDAGHPQNLITGKHYRGINVWLLASLNYSQNSFLTFKQVKELGGTVKKGEKSHMVVFWKWLEKENPQTKQIEKTPLLRYYKVFNVEQCIEIPKEKLPVVMERKNNPIEECEKIINEMPKRPEIRHAEQRAYYQTNEDYVNMPKIETFVNSESYYDTLFHELVHSTGNKERLDRKASNGFRTKEYAIEELTAEMGASYLKSYAGIPIQQLEDNAAYIQGWLKRLQEDKKYIVHASAQAQKAADYILNIKNEEKELEVQQPLKSVEREKELMEVRGQKTDVIRER